MPFDTARYTIGWICALPAELIAARCHLDEEHNACDFRKPSNDNNAYSFGRIGQHDVVIATLPKGEYGTNSATAVARDLVRTFDIKIGLMVGIGGGAPLMETGQQDIRLGDVVVSTPEGGKGGVYQYDFGKAQDTFKTTGQLNAPPISLRTTITTLDADMQMHGHELEVSIGQALTKYPRLRKTHTRPAEDNLYSSTFAHPDGTTCTACANHRIERPPRDEIEIHYGIIASGNAVMRNASLRNTLATEHKVLCFEMEAAGLMNQFPFLIVRGICDYSDSHKTKQWQGFAAMTAASYTRKLLLALAPGQVAVEKRIELQEAIQEVSSATKDIKKTLKTYMQQERDDRLFSWLKAPDPSSNHNAALELRHEGTGSWLLADEQYRQVLNTERLVWLHGFSGCGKTVLSSALIQQLPPHATLYFYFDFQDVAKQSFEGLLKALLRQLYCKSLDPDCTLLELRDAHGHESASVARLDTCLRVLLARSNVRIIIDALDECTERDKVLPWISSIVSMPIGPSIIVTSRPESDIRKMMPGQGSRCNIELAQEPVDKDIQAYVKHRLATPGGGFERWHHRPLVQAQIETCLTKNAHGMFRWAACLLVLLKEAHTPDQVDKELKTLPPTLAGIYARMLERIRESAVTQATQLLQLLIAVDHPMRVEEAAEALAVDLEEQTFHENKRMGDVMELAMIAKDLVVLRSVPVKRYTFRQSEEQEPETEMRVQLAHLSVKEYLLSLEGDPRFGGRFKMPVAQTMMASTCLIYLLCTRWVQDRDHTDKQFPLLAHAVHSWKWHLGESNESMSLRSLLSRFFRDERAIKTYLRVESFDGQQFTNPPLHVAASLGLQDVVRELLAAGVDINVQGGYYGYALTAACASYPAYESDQISMAKLLLSAGAEVNAWGGEYGTALIAATHIESDVLVKLLLDSGAIPTADLWQLGYTSCSSIGSNALAAACSNNMIGSVRLLLEAGADPNQGVVKACSAGRLDILQLLVAAGADINQKGILRAACKSHVGVVRYLLEIGIRPDDPDALSEAAAGQADIVKLLVDQGARITPRALEVAAKNGHHEIVELMLSHSPDIDYSNILVSACANPSICKLLLYAMNNEAADPPQSHQHTSREPQRDRVDQALRRACFGGHKETVRLLLSYGAAINATADAATADAYFYLYERRDWASCLVAASQGGHLGLVKELLAEGADIKQAGALHAASQFGHIDIVKLLLEHGADRQVKAWCQDLLPGLSSAHHCTAVKAAIIKGHQGIVEMLLAAGYTIADEDLLHAAAARGNVAVATMLLQHGLPINAKARHTSYFPQWGDLEVLASPLEIALRCHHVPMAHLFHDHGATIESCDPGLLHFLCRVGHLESARFLLSCGADANMHSVYDFDSYTKHLPEEQKHGSALDAALEGGHAEVEALLLQSGAEAGPGCLQVAALRGHETVVSILLEKGQRVDEVRQFSTSRGGNGIGRVCCRGTALGAAIAMGHWGVERLLLDAGACEQTFVNERPNRDPLRWVDTMAFGDEFKYLDAMEDAKQPNARYEQDPSWSTRRMPSVPKKLQMQPRKRRGGVQKLVPTDRIHRVLCVRVRSRQQKNRNKRTHRPHIGSKHP